MDPKQPAVKSMARSWRFRSGPFRRTQLGQRLRDSATHLELVDPEGEGGLVGAEAHPEAQREDGTLLERQRGEAGREIGIATRPAIGRSVDRRAAQRPRSDAAARASDDEPGEPRCEREVFRVALDQPEPLDVRVAHDRFGNARRADQAHREREQGAAGRLDQLGRRGLGPQAAAMHEVELGVAPGSRGQREEPGHGAAPVNGTLNVHGPSTRITV